MTRRWEWVAVTLVLLLAAALRCWNLGDVPPGLSHDEVANGLIAQDILDGHHALYFTAAYGHEPLYHYAQAATAALFGGHWLGLRWPSLAFSLLGIAATYVLVRRLFDPPVALLTIIGLSISFWPLFYARVGLRAISLPFTAAVAAYFLLRTLDQGTDRPTRRFPHHVLGGLFLGLSLYTYMAARVLPLILSALVLHRLLFLRALPLPWSRLLVLFLVAALVASPLLIWLALHPDAEYRISEVREPLDRLLAGDPSLVWHNLVANASFFTFTGDPWPHQGIPGRPVFADPIGAVLFWLGLLITVWRWRSPRHGFLLVWVIGALMPSILSSHAPPDLVSDAPSSIRNILGVVVTFVFPALALVEGGRWIKERTKHPERSRLVPLLLPLAALLLLPAMLRTRRDYFDRWPQREDVRYFYQADLTAVGHHLDTLAPDAPVTVAGLSVHTMDLPTLALTARTPVQRVRLCDPRQTLIIPGHDAEATVLVPRVVPFDEEHDLRRRLTAWAESEPYEAFTSYRVRDRAALNRHLQGLNQTVELFDGTSTTLPASFSHHLTLLGYERLASEGGESIGLLTYWRVEAPPDTRLKTFVHLLDNGELIAQDDGLASPPQSWIEGDLIVQKHDLTLPSDLRPGLYTLQLGLYNESSRVRLLTRGQEALLLPPVPVP